MADPEEPTIPRQRQFIRPGADWRKPQSTPESKPSAWATRQIARTEAAWTFVARRAAWEDASELYAQVAKLRVGTIAVHVSFPEGHEDEEPVGHLIRKGLQREFGLAGIRTLAFQVLPKGSYGAVIFVESPEPSNRDDFFKRVQIVGRNSALAVLKELKGRLAGGVVTIALGGIIMIFGLGSSEPLTCDTRNQAEFQQVISEIRTPSDFQNAAEKYCIAPDDSTRSKILKAFNIK